MLSNEEYFTFVKIMIKNISLICQLDYFYYTALWNTALFLDFFFPSFPLPPFCLSLLLSLSPSLLPPFFFMEP